MAMMLLIHGGLREDMDAERFWGRSGIVSGLEQLGYDVSALNRARNPVSWEAEATHFAQYLPSEPCAVIAGSNGCSVAILLALRFPAVVTTLILAWPATAGDPRIDTGIREKIENDDVAHALLSGGSLRGVSNDGLRSLRVPTKIIPSILPNIFHSRRTVDELLRLIPRSKELPGTLESPHPRFAEFLPRFLSTVTQATT
jgi:pimeloyl-ACP methyl ester carboxylesterase